MYIEELSIDHYLQQLQSYEQAAERYEKMEQEQQWEAEEPVPPEMSETVQKYYERGELFLDERDEWVKEEEHKSEALDVLRGG